MNSAAQIIPTRKIWPTPGGVHPPDNKSQSLQLPLAAIDQPPWVVLPLNQHLGAPAEAVVKVGDTVLKGQLIAAAKGNISANVHASISGRVVAIEPRPIAHPSGMEDICIVIDNDGINQWCDLYPTVDYRQHHSAELVDRIRAAGVVGMGGAGFPTAIKLAPGKKITTLIINATECEPYITADDSLMQNFSGEIIDAVILLDYLLEQPADILIAIEDNKPEAIAAMQNAVQDANDPRIAVVELPTKYPSGGEKQLIQMLTGKELASGQLPAQLGIVCQNVATVVAAYRAVVKGEPLISRITTLSGAALDQQQNLIVPLGTPIKFLLQQQGLKREGLGEEKLSRLVMGGPMMGFTLTDTTVPIVKTSNCILALSEGESPPPQPTQACIRCGMCAEACPASLLPQQLYWYARAEDHHKLEGHHLFDCIECGACSYVCPSHIPLVQYYRAAKADIRQATVEKQHSDRARQRFEFHKHRVEHEKRARTEAKQLAAEKAKQRNKEKLLPAQAAQANEAAVNHDKAKNDKAKLERNLLSAEDRLNKLKQKHAELEINAPEQAPAVQARINESELKCQNLRDKLSSLSSGTVQQQPATTASPDPVSTSTPPSVSTPTSGHQLNQWLQQLDETRTALAAADPSADDKLAALRLAAQILENKIAQAQVDEGLSDQAIRIQQSDNPDYDPVQRAMENALTKSHDYSEQPSKQATDPDAATDQGDKT